MVDSAAHPPTIPTFTVVIPVFNSLVFLDRCFSALRAASSEHPSIQVVTVDNGSTDGSIEWLSSQPLLDIQLIQMPGASIAALRNAGARAGSGTILSFVDSDCLVSPDYFSKALEVFEKSGADAIGCYYALPESATWVERTWDALHAPATDGFTHMINAGNFLIRRKSFEAVGGFNERLTTGEDAELGIRLGALGLTQYQSSQIVAVHIGNPRTLRQFLRKEIWHARGMLASARGLDRLTLLTVVHGLCTAGAAASLLPGLAGDWEFLVLAAALPLLVPAAAVIYRSMQTRRSLNLASALLLYLAYFTARVLAFPAALREWAAFRRAGSPAEMGIDR